MLIKNSNGKTQIDISNKIHLVFEPNEENEVMRISIVENYNGESIVIGSNNLTADEMAEIFYDLDVIFTDKSYEQWANATTTLTELFMTIFGLDIRISQRRNVLNIFKIIKTTDNEPQCVYEFSIHRLVWSSYTRALQKMKNKVAAP
jgi:hypothetical protein